MGLSAHDPKQMRPLFAHAEKIRGNRSVNPTSSEEYKPTKRARQHQTRLDASQIDDLVVEYEAGKMLKDLARHYGCHRTTVTSILRSRGVPIRMNSLNDAQIQRAADLYASGLSLTKVGEAIGANAETIRQRLIELGIPRRDVHARS